MNEYFRALQKYVDFTGRDTRKQYWMFILLHLIVVTVLSILDIVIFGPYNSEKRTGGYLTSIYFVIVILPSLAAGVRRLHDTGRSAWNLLWSLLPFIGSIVLLVFYASDGQKSDNKYGPAPKKTV
jgi:uncharacterized membrane protein YhaH (DUF805 family)